MSALKLPQKPSSNGEGFRSDDAVTWRVIRTLHMVAAFALGMWLATVVFWPWLSEEVLSEAIVRRVESFLGTVFCHRMPGRSLSWHGAPLLVCSRCTGVITGYFLGAILALLGAEKFPFWRIPFALLLIVLMGLSWLGGWFEIFQASWHMERVIAGACGGLGGYILISCCVVLFATWLRRKLEKEMRYSPS